MSTDLLAPSSQVSKVAFVEGPVLTSTSWELPSEVTSQSRAQAVTFGVVDSRPRAGDRVGAAVYRFARRLQQQLPIKAVTYATEGNVHLVWTFIPERRKELRERIYGEERRLMADFPDLTFDFNVLALDSLSDRPLLPDDIQGQIVYYRGAP
ncbi:MAG: hypothetical protein DMD96_03895 [Candidatus Rokuibacteriota bacterium]|nr:MAG: hypothetical protein DMD96_03895 [Candidatus Rokubacteria bacterium]